MGGRVITPGDTPPTPVEAGPALVTALAAADWQKVASVLHPRLHLRGLTPGKYNEAKGAGAVDQAIEIFLLAQRPGTRAGVSSELEWVVGQEAYYRVTDRPISWMIILCDGYHRSSPADHAEAPIRPSSARHNDGRPLACW